MNQSLAPTLLITGTDTDTGKTVLTTALIAYWQAHYQQHRLGVMKLMQTGTGDRELYQQLFNLDQSLTEINPLHYQAPLAPPIAARLEGRDIDLAKVWSTLQSLQQQRDFVLVEALGGLGSPVTFEITVADLAKAWRLPIILVVPVKLGAIGQAVANVALARSLDLDLKGIILNSVQPCSPEDRENWTPVDLIESLTQVPVLGNIPHLSDAREIATLVKVASDLELERLGIPF